MRFRSRPFVPPLLWLAFVSAGVLPLLSFLFPGRSAPTSASGVVEIACTGPGGPTSLPMTLPVIAIFFFAQRYFIQGIAMTGIKG